MMALNDMPKIGFGTHRLKGNIAFQKVAQAIRCGYRLVDTGQIYQNEDKIGKAIKLYSIPREEVFIQSKLWFSHYRNPEDAILQSCKNLGTDYVDLYMLHKPNNICPEEHLRAFEKLAKCRQKQLIRFIGVTSFTLEQVQQLISKTGIFPDVVQVECHPFHQKKNLQKFVENLGCVFQAWFPLGSGDKKLLNHPVLKSIANNHEISVPALILMWHRQERHSFVVRSSNPQHIYENLHMQSDALSSMEMSKIRAIDCEKSYVSVPPWLETAWYLSPFGRLL